MDSLQQIYNTLSVYDPAKTTLCVGGAAIAVHLAEAGVDPGPQDDVDVLCTDGFFTAQCANSNSLEGVAKFQIRWPYGDENVRALSPIVDIYPAEDNDDILSFSACEALGGTWFPTYYADCMARPDELVTHQGYSFLSMSKLLVWTAFSGRDKDFVKIDKVLPISRDLGLVTDEESRYIMHERDISIGLRKMHPNRYHARLD